MNGKKKGENEVRAERGYAVIVGYGAANGSGTEPWPQQVVDIITDLLHALELGCDQPFDAVDAARIVNTAVRHYAAEKGDEK